MSHLSRRQLLAGFLGGLVQAAGTVVIARSVLQGAKAQGKEADTAPPPQASLQERADKLATEQESGDDLQEISFLNGGFRNGAFRNGGGGAFRNGAFRNGGFANGGGFRNGAFRNGAFSNGGGFRNGGFANGGFRN